MHHCVLHRIRDTSLEMIETHKAKIAVIGAGLMGHGITQVFALGGHAVTITDTVVQNLDTATARIAAKSLFWA